jgi:Flp pilus assembly protein TadG
MITSLLRAFARRRDGSVTVIGAVSIPILIAMVGFVAEYGNGLLHKVEDQRIADAAAFAAATSYNNNSGNSMSSVVQSVATLNGIPGSAVNESIVTSPSGDGNSAVEVTVTTQSPLLLSQILGNTSSNLTVTATSYAEMKGGAPGCIIALASGGTGVTLSGGTSVTAQACAIASDNTVTVPCGTTITTTAVDYDSSSAPSEPCTGIQAPSGKTLSIKKASTSDPISGQSVLSNATATLTTMSGMSTCSSNDAAGCWPMAVTAAAGTASPNYAYGSTTVPTGCTDTWSSSTATHTTVCTGNGPFDFGSVSFGGGITVNISSTGTAPVYNFASGIDFTGAKLTIGGGTFDIVGGVQTGGGSTVSFGAGTFNIGPGTFSCNGSTGYSICNTGTSLTFGGPSTFNIPGGVYDSGGETLTLGSGTANAFNIGNANDGNSFAQGGGATTVFADSSGAGYFQMKGNLNIGSAGGSCLTLGAATDHYINGYFSTAGGVVLGSGIYTIGGYFGAGVTGGGGVSCGGTTIGVNGANVTIVLGGATTITGSGCTGTVVFCMSAGFSNVNLTAPTSGPTANLVVVGPQTGAAGASLGEGASGADLSGAFYFPTAPITMDGGSSLGSFGSSQCLMLIGSQVTLTGGSALASSCSGLGGGTTSSVVLVQ